MLIDQPYNGIIVDKAPKVHVNIFKGPEHEDMECHDVESLDIYDDYVQYGCDMPNGDWMEVRVFTGQQEDEPKEHEMLVLFQAIHDYAEQATMDGSLTRSERLKDFAKYLIDKADRQVT